MFCEKCGSAINNDSSYCSNCGAFQIRDVPIVNNEYQTSTYNSNSNYSGYKTTFVDENLDKSNVGLNILSWFIPIFGIIYYFLKKNEKPKAAKGTLKTSLISAVVNIIIAIIVAVVAAVASIKSIDYFAENGFDDIHDNNSYYEDYEDYEDQDNDYYFDDENNEDNEDNEEYKNEEDKNSSSVENDIAENVTTSNKNNVNASNDWKNYTIYINGKSIKLPLSYEDFTKTTGCTFEDSQDNQTTLKTNYYTNVTLKDSKGNIFLARFDNNTDDITTLDKCTITSISAYKQYEEDADIVFAGNLRVGDKITEKQLKELFGTPDDTYYSEDGDDYFVYTYFENYDEYYSARSFEITVDDGEIYDIDIEKSY